MVEIPTNYPGASDVFNVPSSPSTTPLSSAGTGSRNHVGHHRDLGDAIMAIQNNATKSTHAHNGLALQGPKLAQENTHESVDTDVAANSLHHTLGLGQFQAAAGNHNHDTRYIRLDGSVEQNITGKKNFPSGANSINIPDFQNAQHNHTTAATGGPAYTASAVSTIRQIDDGPSDNRDAIPGGFTRDINLHNNQFTIPPNVAVIGTVMVHYITGYNAPPYFTTQREHNSFIFVGYNKADESPVYSPDRNIIMNGGNFGGQMWQQTHFFSEPYGSLKRFQLPIPVYIAPSNVARDRMRIVCRVVNSTQAVLDEFTWSISLQFTSSNFITL